MDSLDSFIEELLNDESRREGLINDMISHLKDQPIPSMEQLQTGFTDSTPLHGIYYNYDEHTVKISYRVVDDMYPDRIMSFENFRVVLEGLLVCRRNRKWAVDHGR
ncbi:MAG: hypothetical protein HUJ84_07030 [Veillonella sp.]|nr:hypothetical protein [Veillonella sp.]